MGQPQRVEAAAAGVRINAGSASSYTDAAQQVWLADTYFDGGLPLDRGPTSVSGTANPTLYQSERWGLQGYHIPVPNGRYQVILHWAENYEGITAAGQRVFGVAVQANPLGDIDIFAQAGGLHRALDKAVPATVTTGLLNVTFTPHVLNPTIMAIEVLPVQPTFTVTATESPRKVVSGAPVWINARVTSAIDATAATALEIYDASGARAFRQTWTSRTYIAGRPLSFLANWQAPANAIVGTYVVKVHLSNNLGQTFAETGDAPTFALSAPPPNCAVTLQAQVDGAAAGSTVRVPACLYREVVTINKPLTLDGQGHAEIRGSDVWTNWNKSGNLWVSGQVVPALPTAPDPCLPNTNNRCQHAEQVFLGTPPQTLALVFGNPTAGQFSLDSSRHVVLGDDPTGRTVEVTTRQQWVNIQSDNVTIAGLTMRDAASAPDVVTAIGNQWHSGFILRDSILANAHGSAVSLDGGSGNQILRNDISANGQLGVSGWQTTGALIQGNKIHDNATDGFDPWWAAGGLKVANFTNLTIDGNDVWNNNGSGIWCDINCANVTISNNRVHNQTMNPIFFEVSDGASIYGNSVYDADGWGAIVVSSAGHANVHDNTIARAPSIRLLWENRTPKPASAGTVDQIHDNALVAPTDNQATSWFQMSAGVNGNTDQNNAILTGAAASARLSSAGIPAQAHS